ncbi:MAG: CHAD domain-containing protein [Pseudomonadota bacterium]
MKRPQELGRFPAAEVARQLLLAHLDAAAEAHRRLARHTDVDALHDFRVALRRLRSVLRAYRRQLEAMPKKLRKRLRALARTTNAGRDAEVQLEWLRRQKNIPAMERAGYEWFRRRLERARNRAYTDIRRDVPVYFSAIEGNLRKALRPIAPAKTGSYAAATAGLLVDYGVRLGRKLACIRSIADQDKIHSARIAGKRLRYILEPLAAELSGAKRTVESLKTFQDRFGLLCDDFARARALRQAAETLGADRARAALERASGARAKAPDGLESLLPGLAALARRVEREAARRYAAIERRYLGDAGRTFLKPVSVLAHRLGTAARH